MVVILTPIVLMVVGIPGYIYLVYMYSEGLKFRMHAPKNPVDTHSKLFLEKLPHILNFSPSLYI